MTGTPVPDEWLCRDRISRRRCRMPSADEFGQAVRDRRFSDTLAECDVEVEVVVSLKVHRIASTLTG